MVDVASLSVVFATTASGSSVQGDIGCFTSVETACIGTSAAPTFFPYRIIDGRQYADGGMLINCPSGKAVNVSKDVWPSELINVLVSVGTGKCPAQVPVTETLIEAIGLIFNLLTDSERLAEEAKTNYETKYPKGHFCRLNATLSKAYSLDTRKEADIQDMIKSASETAEEACKEISGRLLAQMIFVNVSDCNIARTLTYHIESRVPDVPLEPLIQEGLFYQSERNDSPPTEFLPLPGSSIDFEPGTYKISFLAKTGFGTFPVSGSPINVQVCPSLYQ